MDDKTDRKLLEQALEALNNVRRYDKENLYGLDDDITALRKRLAQPEQKPVTAQHRFRHPQKTMPDWSAWQECRVSNRPAWEIDSQGYEVEYRNLYAAPQQREWQRLTDDEIDAIDKSIPDGTDFKAAKRLFAREIEAKLKEKND